MEKTMFKGSLLDILIALGLYAVLAAFWVQMGDVPDEVAGYPRFLLAGSFVFNTILLVRALRNYRTETGNIDAAEFGWVSTRIGIYIAAISAYIFFMEKMGFIVATLAFTSGMLLLINVRSLKLLVLLPALMTATIYLLFTYVLQVLLPRGTWLAVYF